MQFLDGVGGQLDHSQVKPFRRAAWRIEDEINACTGTLGAEVLADQELSKNDAISRVRAAFATMVKKIKPTDPGRGSFVFNRFRELTLMEQFEKGGWVSIQPGQYMGAWEPMWGNWRVEKGNLVGTSTGSHLLIPAVSADFGHRYEMNGVVEVDMNQPTKEANGGPVVAWLDETDHYGMWAAAKIAADRYVAANRHRRIGWRRSTT